MFTGQPSDGMKHPRGDWCLWDEKKDERREEKKNRTVQPEEK